MKIATIKQEWSSGHKVTITGTVKWAGKIEERQGPEGAFKTQSLLVVDGEQTDDKRNSIFCGFYVEGTDWGYLKGKEITIQGTVNIYKDNMELRSCKLKEDQPVPSEAQQGGSQPTGASNADIACEYRCKVVCAYLDGGGAEPKIGKVDYWVEYIKTGKAPPPPGQQSQEQDNTEWEQI